MNHLSKLFIAGLLLVPSIASANWFIKQSGTVRPVIIKKTVGAHIVARSLPGISNGLIGYWTFDGRDTDWNTNKTNDVSGSGITGTITSMSTTSPIGGKIGQAFTFNGVASVNIGNPTVLNGGHALTLSAWVNKRTAGAFDAFRGIFAIGGNRVLWLFGSSGSSVLRAQVTTTTGGLGDCDASANVIPDNTWIHVVFYWDGTTCGWYVNGSVSGSTDTSTGNTLSNNDGTGSYIGLIPGFSNWKGNIDDVRLYNRALSLQEIKILYNSSR